MKVILAENYQAEEQIVAELEVLGIRYLSRAVDQVVKVTRPPERLISDLIRQPSSRVPTAIIPLLLAHPEFESVVPNIRNARNSSAS